MRARSFFLGMITCVALLSLSRDDTRAAQDDAEVRRRAQVVAKVGNQVVTLGELEDRLGAVPRFQLAAFGETPDAIRRKFLDSIIVTEVLMSAAAEDQHLERELPTVHLLARVRSNATLRAVRAKQGSSQQISIDDVRKYYDDNKSRYDVPSDSECGASCAARAKKRWPCSKRRKRTPRRSSFRSSRVTIVSTRPPTSAEVTSGFSRPTEPPTRQV